MSSSSSSSSSGSPERKRPRLEGKEEAVHAEASSSSSSSRSYSYSYSSSDDGLGLADLVGSESLSDGASDEEFEAVRRPMVRIKDHEGALPGAGADGIDPARYPSFRVAELRDAGVDPSAVLAHLGYAVEVRPHPEAEEGETEEQLADLMWTILLQLRQALANEPPARRKLEAVNTLDQAVELIRSSQKVLVLSGAGISVSCGIPDFRSKDGLYARLKVQYEQLNEPEDMFDMHYFVHDPQPFFSLAKDLYPGSFTPSASHRFIRALEDRGKLLRNYTQNIDTLENVAGVTRVLQCHGSFASATCMTCRKKYTAEDIREDVMAQRIPRCADCMAKVDPKDEGDDLPWDHPIYAVIKPDITFFHENLADHFYDSIRADRGECDLVIVMGSSLQVRPVCLVVNEVRPETPIILINREVVGGRNKFDVNLLGNSDAVVRHLCARLGWELQDGGQGQQDLKEPTHIPPNSYLFEGGVDPTPPPPRPQEQ